MTGDVLARRYAAALIELTAEDGIVEEAGAQLQDFTAMFENSDLKKVLLDPSCNIDDKAAVINEVAKKIDLGKTLKNFIMLLVEKKRIDHLKSINEAYQFLCDQKASRIKAQVTLPYEPAKEEVEEIRKGIEKSTGKKVIMDVKVDPDILGGVAAKVGSTIYDGSLRTQLENIKNTIVRG